MAKNNFLLACNQTTFFRNPPHQDVLITCFTWETERNKKSNGLQLGVAAIFVDALQMVPERNNLSSPLAVPSEILQLLSFRFKFRQEILTLRSLTTLIGVVPHR